MKKHPHIYCPICVTMHHVKMDKVEDNDSEFVIMTCLNKDCGFKFFVHREYILSYLDPKKQEANKQFKLFWYLPTTKHIRKL